MGRTTCIRWAYVGGVCVLVACLLGACTTHGPRRLAEGQLAYNEAVKKTVDEELLLNVVRLRYNDTIEFLAASSISSQTVISADFGSSIGSLGQDDIAGVSGGVEYQNRPTFTFTPQRGVEFARRLMGPLELRTLTYLASSNWDLDQLLRTFVTEINGISSEAGGEAGARFAKVMKLLGDLQDKNRVVVGFVEEKNPVSQPIDSKAVSPGDYLEAAEKGYRYVGGIDPDVLHLSKLEMQPAVLIPPGTPEGEQLVQLLDLTPGPRPYFAIDLGARVDTEKKTNHAILIRTRSVLMAMAFLAQGVLVPPGDVQKGLAMAHWPSRGATASDLRGFFQVRWSGTRPNDALAVPYRGHWFYVSDCDQSSKVAFQILATLYRLKLSEEDSRGAPILTLPVG